MRDRCENKNNKAYHRYGGRGISVCTRWKKFKNFYADMGLKPTKKHSLERINNNKGYSKKNCRWATQTEQCRNKRNNVILIVKGRKLKIHEACEQFGINIHTLRKRLEYGWTHEKAVLFPLVSGRPKGYGIHRGRCRAKGVQ